MKDHTAIITALISGPAGGGAAAAIAWLRNRRSEGAQVDLTVSETWQTIVGELRKDIADLRNELAVERGRVDDVEAELKRERDRAKGLEAEVDKYRSIARSVLRHMLRLRDVMAKARVDLPDMPPDVEDALTGIDLT